MRFEMQVLEALKRDESEMLVVESAPAEQVVKKENFELLGISQRLLSNLVQFINEAESDYSNRIEGDSIDLAKKLEVSLRKDIEGSEDN